MPCDSNFNFIEMPKAASELQLVIPFTPVPSLEAINTGSKEKLESKEDSDGQPKTSLISTFINFMKANVGTGILTMPYAVKNGGLFVGSICLLFCGMLTTHCCHQLLRASDQVSDGKRMSYSEVTYLSFRRAGPQFKRFAKVAKYTIDACVIAIQLGVCCIFVLAVSRMVKEVVDYACPSLGWDIRIYESLLLVILIPSCFITTLKLQAYFTIFANVATVVGLIVILQYVFRNLQAVENLNYGPPSISSVPLFFGTAMFTFSVVPVALPFEQCMKNRAAFHGWDGLLSLGMSCVIILNIAVGFYGYMAFGSESKMILTNLPNNDWLYNSVKLLMAAAIFLGYNLQMYVVITILYPPFKRFMTNRVKKPWFDQISEYLFRTALVLLTFVVAVSIPCLELMISLIGALTGGFTCLIFPPLLELACCFHQNGKRSWFTYIKCVLILLIGTTGTIVGTFVAIQEVANALSSPGGCQN